MFGVKHFPSRGQLFLFLQLQPSSVSAVLFKTFILWLFITDFMFCMQLTLILFLLNMLLEMWFLGKCRSNKPRKDLPIFVETFLLNGGLNHMIFLLCLLCFWCLMSVGLYDSFLLYPVCRKLFSYCVVDSLNIVSVEYRFERRVSIEAGIWLIIFGGWLDSACM